MDSIYAGTIRTHMLKFKDSFKEICLKTIDDFKIKKD